MTDCGIRQVCEHCLQGKLSRIPFPKMSTNRSSRILDLMHTDVCGPMKCVTPGGCRYLMTLIDDYSRYTVVCLLRQKSEAAGCIKRIVAHVKTKFGRALCVIRSDGGGEYVNEELKDFYASEGIQAQYTAAYSPQQNGVAERKNRSLQEMATCMLLDAGLDKQYWGGGDHDCGLYPEPDAVAFCGQNAVRKMVWTEAIAEAFSGVRERCVRPYSGR